MSIILSKKAAHEIKNIYEHPSEVYSIYLKNHEDVIWVDGKAQLYDFLRKLSNQNEVST